MRVWFDTHVQIAILVAAISISIASLVLSRRNYSSAAGWLAVLLIPIVRSLCDLPLASALSIINLSALIPITVLLVGNALPRREMQYIYLALIAAVSAYSLLQFINACFSEMHSAFPPLMRRWVNGPMLSANHLAAGLAFVAAILCVDSFLRRHRHFAAKALVGGVAATAVFGIILTRSRGSFLALVFTLIIVSAITRREGASRFGIAWVALSCVLLAIAYSPFRGRIVTLIEGNRESVVRAPFGQPERVSMAVSMIQHRKSWMFGVSIDTVRRGIEVRTPEGYIKRMQVGYCSHLNWAWRFGFPAAILSLGIMGATPILAIRDTSAFQVVVGSGCLCLLLCSVTTNIWQHPLLMLVHHTLALFLLDQRIRSWRGW